jgi:hypothetical protein
VVNIGPQEGPRPSLPFISCSVIIIGWIIQFLLENISFNHFSVGSAHIFFAPSPLNGISFFPLKMQPVLILLSREAVSCFYMDKML